MDIKNCLSSIIYYMSASSDSDIITREQRVAIALEIRIDRLFMAMYCRRSSLSYKSTADVRNALLGSGTQINFFLKDIVLNTFESTVFSQLDALYTALIAGTVIPRVVDSINGIETIYNNLQFNDTVIQNLVKSAQFILSLANQFDYSDTILMIPCIRILTNASPYAKTLIEHNVVFKAKRESYQINVNDVWYNIFKYAKIKENDKDTLYQICATINIGTTPDASTGFGISRFLFEACVSSTIVQRFVQQSKAVIIDEGLIKAVLKDNSPSMVQFVSRRVGSLEADYTDTVSQNENDSTKNGGKTEDLEGNDTTSENDTETPDKSDDVVPNENSDTDLSVDEDLPPSDETADNSSDQVGDDATTDNDSSSDDLDNTDESKPVLLGLNLALSKNETLDSFLYKMSVAKYIDNVIEFNHDEIPLETVTLLTKWKSMFLFLTDAEETKRLLKELNIQLK